MFAEHWISQVQLTGWHLRVRTLLPKLIIRLSSNRTPHPPTLSQPQQGDSGLPCEDGLSEETGLLVPGGELRLSDSSGCCRHLDPRFSSSSPPAARSKRQGRGAWAETRRALAAVLRLLVSNARDTDTHPPQPPPQKKKTKTLATHTITQRLGEGRARGRRSRCDLAHPAGQLRTRGEETLPNRADGAGRRPGGGSHTCS